MTDSLDDLGVAEVYRGCELYANQSEERLAEARRQLDEVAGLRSGLRLYEFACDDSKAPEARLLAKARAIESTEDRQRSAFDKDRLIACCIGIERRASALGRLMAWRAAGNWPAAWATWRNRDVARGGDAGQSNQPAY